MASPCSSAIERAQSLRAEGRLDRAARTLERAVAKCAGSEQTAARALHREVLVELGPGPVSGAKTEPLASLREPDTALVRGNAHAALTAYEAIWKNQPRHARALIGAGFAARMLGNERLARAHFDRALAALEAEHGAPAVVVQLRRASGSLPIVSFSAQNENTGAPIRMRQQGTRWLPVQSAYTGAPILMRRHGTRWLPVRKLSGGRHRSGGYSGAQDGDLLEVVDGDGVELFALEGYTDFEVASDQQRVAAWSESKQALFDLRSGRVIAERAGRGALSFAGPNEKWLVDTDADSSMVLDGRSLAERLRIPAPDVLFDRSLERAVALVPDARGFGFGLELWDLGKNERVARVAVRSKGDSPVGQFLDEPNDRFLWWGRELASLDLRTGRATVLGPAPDMREGDGVEVEDGGKRLCVGSFIHGYRVVPSKPRPGFRQRCYPRYREDEGLAIAELPEPAEGRRHVNRAHMQTGGFFREDYEVVSPRADLVARLEHSRAKERYFIAIYSVSTGKLSQLLDVAAAGSHAAPVLRFSVDGTHILAKGLHGPPVAWNVQTGASRDVERTDEPPEEKRSSPFTDWSGTLRFRGVSMIWSGPGGWSWWDLARGVRIHGERRTLDRVLLSPGGHRVALVERKRRPPDYRAAVVTVVDETGKTSAPLEASLEGYEFLVSDTGRVAWWGNGGNWVADPEQDGWRKRQIDSKGRPAYISGDGKWLALEGEQYVVESADTGQLDPTRSHQDEMFVRDNDKMRSPDGKWSFETNLGRTAAAIRLVRSNEVRATLYPTGPESAVALLDGGAVERLGPAGPSENLACVVGSEVAPFEVCEERLLVTGALPKLEAKTYLEP